MNKISKHNEVKSFDHCEDEIRLVDLWLVIASRKWLVFIIIILSFAVGTIYAVKHPVQYYYRTVIDLSRVIGLNAPEPSKGYELEFLKETSTDLLQQVLIPAVRKEMFGKNTHSPQIKVVNQKDGYSLTLSSIALPKEQEHIVKLHKAVYEALIQKHKNMLDKILKVYVNPLKAREAVFREQIKDIETLMEDLTRTNVDRNSMADIIVAQKVGDLRGELIQAKLALADTESSTQTILEAKQGARLMYLAVKTDSPAGISRQLIVLFSVILGFMLGVLGVFIVEFFHKVEAISEHKEGK